MATEMATEQLVDIAQLRRELAAAQREVRAAAERVRLARARERALRRGEVLDMTSRPAMAVRGWTEDPGSDLRDWLARGGDPNAWVAIPDYGQIPTLLGLGCCGPYTFGLADREPAIAALLAAGADPNVGFVVEGRQFRPLFSQAIAGRHGMAIAARLLAHGAAVDAAVEGNTPLVGVAGSTHTIDDTDCRDFVRLLLAYGGTPPREVREHEGVPQTLEEWSAHQPSRRLTHALLRDVRLGGGWKGYVREPRVRLLVLRELCLRGRAAPPRATAAAGAALLARLFVAAPAPTRRQTRTARRARGDDDRRLLGELPTPIFWHVMKFWRSERDYLPPHRNEGSAWRRLYA
jgi:hypothetical protein